MFSSQTELNSTANIESMLLNMDAPLPVELVPSFAEFFASEYTRVPGLDSYIEVFKHSVIFPLQRRRELEKIMQLVRPYHPKVVYEIGADKGGSLYHWIKCLPSVERVIACEIRGLPYQKEFEKAFPTIDFLWLEGSSYLVETVIQVVDWLGSDRIDVLFIDGDKNATKADFDCYIHLISHPGFVLVHDVVDNPVKPAFESVKNRFKTSYIADCSESIESMELEQLNISPSSPYDGWLRHWRGYSCTVGVVYL